MSKVSTSGNTDIATLASVDIHSLVLRAVQKSIGNSGGVYLRWRTVHSRLRIEITGREFLNDADTRVKRVLEEYKEKKIVERCDTDRDIPNTIVYNIEFAPLQAEDKAAPPAQKLTHKAFWGAILATSSATLVYTLITSGW